MICPSEGSFVPGPTEPRQNLGCWGVENLSHSFFTSSAPAFVSSYARSPIWYSSRTQEKDPNVFVVIKSAPAVR